MAVWPEARYMYNWQELTTTISGQELAALFFELTGDAAPAGDVRIDLDKLEEIADWDSRMGDWATAALRAFQA